MPQLVMVKTAAGPMGTYRAGKAYTVSPEIHQQFTEGEHPAALDYSEAAELAVESRGEKPERDWKMSAQPTEINLPGADSSRRRKPLKKRTK